ncbi:cupin domain-containing protein [Siccirubricoccus sp. KC 17139]|uniref:Cupin domain-containing protein n=1 Tax=Siccirubricoccus soli TaxID=2899147 RepID=A0ABT1CY68_9PROT|nr:cupin domain-containing protein [Siccirubricoccus soli]MCO6414604.1 cupin domain-containing protein [Siccirubricoccus soli]MCP2680734.1 cupin domain-containing protein [Siccirubricoccus soli]
MKILRAESRATKSAPASNFTGTVFSDEVLKVTPPSRMRASAITFTPGARTNWHTHPLGQTLYCLSGIGRIQKEGEQVQALYPGDTVVIPPGVRHWHGAAPDRVFSHLAMSEDGPNGESTAWFEPVSEADYTATPQG